LITRFFEPSRTTDNRTHIRSWFGTEFVLILSKRPNAVIDRIRKLTEIEDDDL